MWVAHWILGLAYYTANGMAVWADHVPATPSTKSASPLGMKTAILVPAVLTAHVLQHTYHAYLYRLRTENKGYQLPSHPLFPNLLCPHYTCEVAIYALLSLLGAPEGSWVNWTWVCGTIFVAVNLGVTADGTKEWYEQKFGAEKVRGRKRMIPGVW
jgi:3-oxo-5-alpha-steroid 4-dehydrogenase 3